MDTPPSANLRSRSKPSQMATPNGLDSPSTAAGRTTAARSSTATTSRRNSPFLPTPTEALALAAYPTFLVFGTLFSLLSPETRAAPYGDATQTHYTQDSALAPSYFARKGNLFNVLFVKRGWAWVTVAFFAFALTHPALTSRPAARLRAIVRYALVTAWWVLVTQWCFGPAIIDRGFRYTGGKCDVAQSKAAYGDADAVDLVTAVACKGAGGRWAGGHDISGHVFLLVLGSFFLAQEVGWVVARGRRAAAGGRDERSVVMGDGAVKSAEVEAEEAASGAHGALGIGGKVAGAVGLLSLWMLLMTAIYFHTWFEKLTGLLVALSGLYTVYVLPRWVPAVRGLVGLPGI